MSAKGKKLPVKMKYLMERVNRKLVPRGEKLMGKPGQNGGNAFFLLDLGSNTVTDVADPAKLARRVGALRPWETVEA